MRTFLGLGGGVSTGAVSRWPRTFARPEMSLTATCSPRAVVDALLTGLATRGFRVSGEPARVPGHELAEASVAVRVRRVDWLSWVTLLGAESCVLELRAVPTEVGAVVTVVVTGTGTHPAPSLVAAGLSDAVAALRSSGVAVEAHDWHAGQR